MDAITTTYRVLAAAMVLFVLVTAALHIAERASTPGKAGGYGHMPCVEDEYSYDYPVEPLSTSFRLCIHIESDGWRVVR